MKQIRCHSLTLEFRDFKRFYSNLFKMALDDVDWSPVFSSSNANESLSRFRHIFNSISNKHAPLKAFKIRNSASKPWITLGLKKSIKVWDKLYKKWLITQKPLFLNKYKLYRNKVTLIILHLILYSSPCGPY